jgi:hypothetical protein
MTPQEYAKSVTKNETYQAELIKAFEAGESNWISVDERLPENEDGGKQNIKVIAYGYRGDAFECVYNPLLQIFMNHLTWQQITWIRFWMLLPKPPKQSK